jgi:tryptophan synthase alpha subunit
VAVGEHADAVVIGSALIRLMETSANENQDPVVAAYRFLHGIRQALDQRCTPLQEVAL